MNPNGFDNNETAEITALFPIAVGGYVTQNQDQGIAVMVYVLPSGQHLHLAVTDLLAAIESKALELRTALMDTAETLRDLGLDNG